MSNETLRQKDTVPSFSEEESEQINDTFDIKVYLGRHASADDAAPIVPLIEQADIVIPEFGGWNSAALESAAVYVATPEQKKLMTDSERQKGRDFSLHVFRYGPFAQAVYKPLRNSGKLVRFIDIQDDHPLVVNRANADDNFFSTYVAKGTTTGVFTADLERYTANFAELEPFFRDRERTIRTNLHTVLNELSSLPESPLEKRKLLIIFGTAHSPTLEWLQSNKIPASVAEGSDNTENVDMYVELLRDVFRGYQPTKLQIARAMMSGLFLSIGKNYLQNTADSSTKALSRIAIGRYFAENLDFNDLGALWNTPDDSLTEKFEEIIVSSGLLRYGVLKDSDA